MSKTADNFDFEFSVCVCVCEHMLRHDMNTTSGILIYVSGPVQYHITESGFSEVQGWVRLSWWLVAQQHCNDNTSTLQSSGV